MITISNTGRTITVLMDVGTHDKMRNLLRTDKFRMSFKDGMVRFHPSYRKGVGRGTGRAFYPTNSGKPGFVYTNYKSSEIPDLPLFGKHRSNGFLGDDGFVKIPLPPEDRLSEPTPRTMVLRNGKRKNGTRKGRWKTPEARERSIAALKANRYTPAKKRVIPAPEAKVEVAELPAGTPPSSNLIVGFGGKTLSFNVPEDKLLDFVLQLSEDGYRVKA